MKFTKNFEFQMSIFFKKYSMIFKNSLIKSLIHKIKEQIVNRKILTKIISHINIFLKELLEFSRNR